VARGWFDSAESLPGCGRTILARGNFDGPHVWQNRIILPQDDQKGRLARPQQVKSRGVHTALRVGRSPLEWIFWRTEKPVSDSDIRETLFCTLRV
jgi:hypothetical protein